VRQPSAVEINSINPTRRWSFFRSTQVDIPYTTKVLFSGADFQSPCDPKDIDVTSNVA